MKNITLTATTIGILLSSAFAGDLVSAPEATPKVTPEATPFSLPTISKNWLDDWFLTPTVDARLRFEHRDQQGLNGSNSGTFRIRPGLKTKDVGGFSLYAEGEFSFAFIDDFESSPGGGGTTSPSSPGQTVIADPETGELNQAYIQYAANGLTLRVGRQLINLDGQEHVGSVGWRNNEQTFDAASVSYKNDDVELFYAYTNRVNRIFGSSADGGLKRWEGDAHLINAKANIGSHKVGGYIYLLDFDDLGALASSNTYGVFTTLDVGPGTLHLEGAVQTDAGDVQVRGDYTDYFAHVYYSQKVGGIVGTAGVFTFGEDFIFPLQTAHKFNGFADAFLLAQLGIPGPRAALDNGLADIYVSAVKKGLPGGIKAVGALHYFADADFGDALGYEADLVLVKPINENLTALAKFAYYLGDDNASNSFQDDVVQATIQLDYTF